MKKSKRSLFTVMGLSAVLLLGACGSEGASNEANADGKEYDLKMSVTVSDSSTWYEAAQKLKEDLAEESDGRINLEIFANEQLSGGDSGKAVEGLSKGTIDLTFNSTIIYSILDERFGVASAPFLFSNLEEVDGVFNGEGGEKLKEVLAEKGVHALGYGQNGFRQLTNSVREVKSPDDIEGLKLRIPGIQMYTDLYRELGTDPVTMTFSEVFTALQQGTIDGQENPIDVIYSSKLNEVQDYITMWNYSYDPLVLGMNKELYESMSDEDKELFDRLGKEAAEYQVELAREKEAGQIEELKAAGMQFYEPTEEELAAFKEQVQPLYDKYTDIWGADLLEAFQP
ncbi:C4-dicarboxylate ABC transporter substrate-binding protein [Chryseomicrobium excrementi]|uniref:C4-dicarboxylate ABC transporter substrate-binding protein n=1 Tax=Chryseomicrobium excrementi TaxID=2041346 RepID=A0A2M9F0V6_9BACL|nr:DctP family TRAP transporter solute-binding subunit [Chryseomicrobium excrementi]PJK17087.1 C4-dicarboxylate ABC transporter substrate-binding protein [Chryseomicrobium excrementi]